MTPYRTDIVEQTYDLTSEIKKSSDKVIDYFLACLFLIGLILAGFYNTWVIAIIIGGISILTYYAIKRLFPNSNLYQYILSIVLGIFMAQFIYQMHGLFEMRFFAIIGGVLLIMYQEWKLQVPIALVVVIHHSLLCYLQYCGYWQVYFTQPGNFDFKTNIIYIVLATSIFCLCGLFANRFRKYRKQAFLQATKIGELEKELKALSKKARSADVFGEHSVILESISDGFFAVDNDWIVTYWNSMAENALGVSKQKVLGRNLWEVFADSINSKSYQQYEQAMKTGVAVDFEDYYPALEKWYAINVYPSSNGLAVYFKDITEQKISEVRLTESEKRYSDLFHLSPLPMWVFDINTTMFLDVNEAAINHYGLTKDEFLSMTIRAIRPEEEVQLIEQVISANKAKNRVHHEHIFRHRTKSGEIILVDIQSVAITYEGKQAKLVLANDVTDRINYLMAVEQQNEKLKEIAWMQSHLVRAPLAKILGLIPLISDTKAASEDGKMLKYLQQSANELDEIIGSICAKAETIEITRTNLF